ncbi:hypothetical protein Peur_027517 [Populus x canadensis]
MSLAMCCFALSILCFTIPKDFWVFLFHVFLQRLCFVWLEINASMNSWFLEFVCVSLKLVCDVLLLVVLEMNCNSFV